MLVESVYKNIPGWEIPNGVYTGWFDADENLVAFIVVNGLVGATEYILYIERDTVTGENRDVTVTVKGGKFVIV